MRSHTTSAPEIVFSHLFMLKDQLHMVATWLVNSGESLKINMIEFLPLGTVMKKMVKFLCDKGFKLGKHYPCEYYHPAKDDLEVNYLFTY